MSKKIYIVLSYKNRKHQFLYTLKRLDEYNSIGHNLCIIVVDDGSDPGERLEGIVDDYNFYIQIFYIKPTCKDWINPCVTYNIGFYKIPDANDDDIVIIQNPECAHLGNILEYAINNLTHKDYFVFNCMALNKDQSASLIKTDKCKKSLSCSCGAPDMYDFEAGVDWYIHPKFRKKYYHFCSCLTYKNLKTLNGFDMAFKNGDAFDDDEFALRVKRLGLKRQLISNPRVAHLWHPAYQPSSMENLYKNRDLYSNVESNTTSLPTANSDSMFGLQDGFIENYSAKSRKVSSATYSFSHDWNLKKIPKVAHFYWGADKMSFLRYLTLVSFIKFNPTWEVRLYIPNSISNNLFWRDIGDNHHKCDQIDYINEKDYFSLLPPSIKIIKIDFSTIFIGETAPEAHKSDLLGWQILSTAGGLWCDMDILFFKGLHEIIFNEDCYDTLVCYDHRHIWMRNPVVPIGFFFSCPNNAAFNEVLEVSKLIYQKDEYQAIGTYAISSAFRTVNECKVKFPKLNIGNLDYDLVYRYDYLNLNELYVNNNFRALLVNDDSIGVHWYGGDPQSQEFNNTITGDNYKSLPSCTIVEIIKYLNLDEKCQLKK